MAQPSAVERFQDVGFRRGQEVVGCIWRDYGVIAGANSAIVAGTGMWWEFQVWLRTLTWQRFPSIFRVWHCPCYNQGQPENLFPPQKSRSDGPPIGSFYLVTLPDLIESKRIAVKGLVENGQHQASWLWPGGRLNGAPYGPEMSGRDHSVERFIG